MSESEKYKLLLHEYEEYKTANEDKLRLLKHQNMLTDIKMKDLQGMN